MTIKCVGCKLPPVGARRPASITVSSNSFATGSDLNLRVLWRVLMHSKVFMTPPCESTH